MDALLVIPVCIFKATYYHPQALVDSGANKNIIDSAYLEMMDLVPWLKEILDRTVLADGSCSRSGSITHKISLTILVGDGFPPYKSIFQVMKLGVADIILGIPFLRIPFLHALHPQINWANHTIHPPASTSSALPSINTVISSIEVVAPKPSVPVEYQGFSDLFDKKLADKLPPHRSFDHTNPLVEGKVPPFGPIYSLSVTEHAALKDYIDDNLEKGFITPSSSPAGLPILFVKKKDGGLGLCVDYRQLNEITIKNRYLLSLIGDLIDKLKSAKVYSKIDLCGAYKLLRIAKGEEWKTAFRIRHGLYKYKVMPFGLMNAPASFQHLMNWIFRDILDISVIIYLDDILVYSNNQELHVRHVWTVLTRLWEFDVVYQT